jgi:hypothetical protein
MKIQNKPITSLAGEEVKNKDGSVFMSGDAIAEILLNNTEGEKLKCFVLAQKFYSEKEVELDASDKELVKKAIEQNKIYTNLVSGQLLLSLE